MDTMEIIISRIEKQGLYRLGCQLSEFYDEQLVEEFYRDASVKLLSQNEGGGVDYISAKVQGVRVCIDKTLLMTMFHLPSEGLTLEQLESFGSKKLLTAYWGLFTGDSSNTEVQPSCNKKEFCLPFVFLHDFCCRVIENRTGSFEACTNLRFRMMVAILYEEKVDWCQIVLKRLGEEVVKPLSQKKSFGFLLNSIIFKSGIPLSRNAVKISPRKFIGGSKPTTFNHAGYIATRPFIETLPTASRPRGVSAKATSSDQLSKKRKRSLSDSTSKHPKKLKSSISKDKDTVSEPITVQILSSELSENPFLQDTASDEIPTASIPENPFIQDTPSEENPTCSNPVNPEPTANMPEQHTVAPPERVPIPEQDPTHNRSPSPMRDPSPVRTPISVHDPSDNRSPSPERHPTPIRVPSPEKDSTHIQDSTPVEDLIPTESQIPVRSPSPESPKKVDQEENLHQEEIATAIQDEVITIAQSDDIPESSSNPNQELVSRDIPHEESIPVQNQASDERQRIIELPPSPSASSSKQPYLETLETISLQTIFLQDAVNALYNVSKEMDWLKLAASEEMSSVKGELTKIARAFTVLPSNMKKAISDFQKIQEQSLLEEQAKIRISESKTVAMLEYTDNRISDQDRKIEDMTKTINSLAKKLSKFEEQQDSILKVLRNIDHTVSKINARKGEDDQHKDQQKDKKDKHRSES